MKDSIDILVIARDNRSAVLHNLAMELLRKLAGKPAAATTHHPAPASA